MLTALLALQATSVAAQRVWVREFKADGWTSPFTVKEGEGAGVVAVPTPKWTNRCILRVTSLGDTLKVQLDFPLAGEPAEGEQIVFGMFNEEKDFRLKQYKIVVFNWSGTDLPTTPEVRVGEAALLLPGLASEARSTGKNIAVSITKPSLAGKGVSWTLRHKSLVGYKPYFAELYWLPKGRTHGPNVLSHTAALFDFEDREGSVFHFFPQLWPLQD